MVGEDYKEEVREKLRTCEVVWWRRSDLSTMPDFVLIERSAIRIKQEKEMGESKKGRGNETERVR